MKTAIVAALFLAGLAFGPAVAEAPEACASKCAENSAEFSVSEQQEIERLAYSYFEARGGQEGSSEDDWFRAEQEVRRRRETTSR